MNGAKAEQQRRFLVILFVALAAVLAWRLLPVLFPGPSAAARAREEQRALIRGTVRELNLAALDVPTRDYTRGRNIFHFGPKPSVRRPPPPPPPPPVVDRAQRRPPPPAPPPPRRPPDFRLKLLGIFGPDHRRIAVFKDGEKIMNVLEQGTVKDKFFLSEINLDYVDVAHQDFPDNKPQRVRIGKKK